MTLLVVLNETQIFPDTYRSKTPWSTSCHIKHEEWTGHYTTVNLVFIAWDGKESSRAVLYRILASGRKCVPMIGVLCPFGTKIPLPEVTESNTIVYFTEGEWSLEWNWKKMFQYLQKLLAEEQIPS